MVRVSSPAKLRPWSELTAQNGDGGGSCVGDKGNRGPVRGTDGPVRGTKGPVTGTGPLLIARNPF